MLSLLLLLDLVEHDLESNIRQHLDLRPRPQWELRWQHQLAHFHCQHPFYPALHASFTLSTYPLPTWLQQQKVEMPLPQHTSADEK